LCSKIKYKLKAYKKDIARQIIVIFYFAFHSYFNFSARAYLPRISLIACAASVRRKFVGTLDYRFGKGTHAKKVKKMKKEKERRKERRKGRKKEENSSTLHSSILYYSIYYSTLPTHTSLCPTTHLTPPYPTPLHPTPHHSTLPHTATRCCWEQQLLPV
jgi:hypothetical protein